MRTVKFYGGPAHGWTYDSDAWDIRVPVFLEGGFGQCRYVAREYLERHTPTIFRSIWVATLDGRAISRGEQNECDNDLRKAPWRILYRVTMASDWHEYWAQAVLRHCHRLVDYRGRALPGRVEVAPE